MKISGLTLRKRGFKAALFLCLLAVFGCSTVKEATRGFLGVSTRALEDGRKDAIKETFDADLPICYEKSREILLSMSAYIYAEDRKKNLIAIYLSAQDTTPVGVFFQRVNGKKTELEVSSPSTYAREYIALKLFPRLLIALSEKEEGAAAQTMEKSD